MKDFNYRSNNVIGLREIKIWKCLDDPLETIYNKKSYDEIRGGAESERKFS